MLKYLVAPLVALVPLATFADPCKYGFFDAVKMTQAERKVASIAKAKCDAPKHTPQELARWECSARIKSAAYVPDSVEWVNRTQWPTVQRDGAWHVVATFTARNRLGVEVQSRKACKVVL